VLINSVCLHNFLFTQFTAHCNRVSLTSVLAISCLVTGEMIEYLSDHIFGRIGRISSEEVILQLINSKCIPMLIYGMEVCPLTKSDLRALDFVVDRFFMKLSQTSNMEVIRHAQCMFNFTLPSLLIKKRSSKFYTGT